MDFQFFDDTFFELITSLRSPIFDLLSYLISFLGDGWLWVCIALLLVAVSSTRRRIFGYASLLALGLSVLVVELILKPLVDRARPFEVLSSVTRLGELPFGASFPSGHVTTAAAMAWILAAAFPRWRYGFALLPLVMAGSRLYNGVHWPSDVLAGWLLGTFLGWVSLSVVRAIAR